jgi:predicted ribosomally synthesized peptide with SipW-like signal peptide
MKKILGLTVAALMVMGLVGGGTWAYFSDTETSTGNVLTAGTLDLEIGGTGVILEAALADVKPGDGDPTANRDSVTLTNTGSIAGELDISIPTANFVNADNGQEEPENDQSDDSTTGDLGSQAKMVLWIDANENDTFDAGDVELNASGGVGTANAYDAGTNSTLDLATIDDYDDATFNDAFASLDESGGTNPSVDLVIDWQVPTSVTNRIMGDSVTFNIEVELEQAAND